MARTPSGVDGRLDGKPNVCINAHTSATGSPGLFGGGKNKGNDALFQSLSLLRPRASQSITTTTPDSDGGWMADNQAVMGCASHQKHFFEWMSGSSSFQQNKLIERRSFMAAWNNRPFLSFFAIVVSSVCVSSKYSLFQFQMPSIKVSLVRTVCIVSIPPRSLLFFFFAPVWSAGHRKVIKRWMDVFRPCGTPV